MKKLVSLVMMLVMMLAITPLESQAQLTKAEQKEAKKAAKELVKDGWKIQGTGTIEGNMIRIMDRQAKGEILLTGADLANSAAPDAALSNCISQAINEYVRTNGEAIIKERVATEVARQGGQESSNMVDMAEQRFIKELKGELRTPALKITRGSAANADFQIQCWWLISENRMEQIRERAIKQALNDVESAGNLGEKISDFVNGSSDEK